MPIEPVAPGHAPDLSHEQRWDVWMAKGVEDDRKFRTHAILAAATLAVLTAVGLFLTR
jgi:hypothetical protein